MDLLDHILADYSYLRHLVQQTAKGLSWWQRYLWGSALLVTVEDILQKHESSFGAFDHVQQACDDLRSGDPTAVLEQILPVVPLHTPGHVLTGIAFCAYLVRRCSIGTPLTPGFILDTICLHLWLMLRRDAFRRDHGTSPDFSLEDAIRPHLE
ncbi:hypothetical protein E1B 19K [Mastadenovirus porcusquartum]|uniref:E1B protein, small T-antigen n=1 Tax=Mastadenovirus porcusquartum TaxID=3241439 RepID=A0A7H0S529_9ADEN|nr:hypothetical protein E1B 19K [Porcine mastadenovirus B]QNQ79238.1 hypothetical protein E1B 19K [Porcine mastadenovirus B]